MWVIAGSLHKLTTRAHAESRGLTRTAPPRGPPRSPPHPALTARTISPRARSPHHAITIRGLTLFPTSLPDPQELLDVLPRIKFSSQYALNPCLQQQLTSGEHNNS